MEAENGPAETTNKQGRIIKLNNKKWTYILPVLYGIFLTLALLMNNTILQWIVVALKLTMRN